MVIAIHPSPLPLFVNAEVLEIDASFAALWYFWEDLVKVGPQLITLRLEVIEGEDWEITESVKKFAKERFKKGMPLTNLERMTFKGASKEDEEKANKLWEEFRADLDIDRYLAT